MDQQQKLIDNKWMVCSGCQNKSFSAVYISDKSENQLQLICHNKKCKGWGKAMFVFQIGKK